jgi:hypothetical protein
LFGGVGGSLIPGTIVVTTGSFDGAILIIVVGAFVTAFILFVLARQSSTEYFSAIGRTKHG